MNNQYFDRYQFFEENGTFKMVPGIEIPIKTTDKYFQYKKGKTRLDKASDQHYSAPYFGWLILQANPLAGSIEFEIPDNFWLRVPFPLISTLQDYRKSLELYRLYYGE